jgi:hypothetical protein
MTAQSLGEVTRFWGCKHPLRLLPEKRPFDCAQGRLPVLVLSRSGGFPAIGVRRAGFFPREPYI